MPPDFLKTFSLQRALLSAAQNKGQITGCFEAEISQELTRGMESLATNNDSGVEVRLARQEANSFFLPFSVLFRDLTSTNSTTGGNLVQTDVEKTVPLLRNRCIVAQLGATVMDDLKGNLVLPRQTLGATLDWLPEQGAANSQDYNFGALTLAPHRCAGAVKFTKQLSVQTAGSIETFLRNDLRAAFAAALDKAALIGIGASSQPLGILNTTGVGSITFSGAATWANVCDFEGQVGEASADVGSLGWASSPATREKWRQTLRGSSTGEFLWKDENTVAGYPAAATKNISTNQVVFGNFADLIVGIWGQACEIIVNPYSFASTGTVQMILNFYADTGTVRPASFAVSADSGAQ